VLSQREPRDAAVNFDAYRISQRHIRVRARGLEELQPLPDSGKTIIFPTKAKFFGQKPAAKNEKICIFVLLNEKN